MGAGAVKPAPSEGHGHSEGRPQGHTQVNLGARQLDPEAVMSCENCSISFTLFKRRVFSVASREASTFLVHGKLTVFCMGRSGRTVLKLLSELAKICCECSRHHCSTCLPKEPNRPSNQRVCSKCKLLISGNFNRNDLMLMKVKDLRLFLARRNVPTQHCKEKNDLVELTLRYSNSSQYLREQEEHQRHLEDLQHRRRQDDTIPESGSQSDSSPPSSSNPSQPITPPGEDDDETEETRAERLLQRQQREMHETEIRLHEELHEEETVDSRPAKQRAKIEHVNAEGDIEELKVKQLKEILATNFVDYKGCCEKQELVDRVKRLWYENQANKGRENSVGDNDLCKICMDKVIDCVLLECGHMVTCTGCGKRLAECPICRQNIIRVVHTFKA